MRLRRKILLGLAGVLLLTPMAVLYLAVSTQAGLRFIVRHLHKVGPVTIIAENVSGSLADGFTIGSLRVQQPRVDVQITGAVGRLRLLPLLRRRIELSTAQAHNLTVQVFHLPPGTKHASGTLWFMPPTLSVEADLARADSTDLILINGQKLHATALSAAVEVLPDVIRIRGGQLDWQEMHIAADGRVHARDPIGLDGKVAADWHPKDQPAWRFDTSFDGNLDRLPLKLDIGKPFHAHVDGIAASLTDRWKFTGNSATDDLDISVWGGGTALGILSARAALTFDSNGFTAKGPVTAPGLNAGPVQLDFRGAYADHRLTIRDSTAVHRPSGSRATVRGTVDVVRNGPRLALSGEWTTLQWPLAAAEPAFTSSQGHYAIEGLRPWKVRADGQVATAGLAGMPASLSGSLGAESLTIEAATLGLYGGNAKVTGEARWRPVESWNVAGHMAGLDSALLRADVPGRLDFDFRAAGTPFGSAGGIDFTLSRLAGKLRGQAATGSGRFEKPAGSMDWRFHQVDLHLGRARIQLDGSLGAPRDLKFAIDADDLSLLDETARGRISARGRYAGTDAAPLLLFKARGTDFEWQGYRIDAIDADVDVDLQGEGHAQGKVDLEGVRHGAYTVRQAALALTGTGKTQHLALNVDAAPLRAALTAEGGMDQGLWRGNVSSFTVNDGAELSLRLKQAAPVALALQQLELGDLCLTGDEANGCLNGKLDPEGHWNTTFSVQAIPLRAFTAGLSQNIDYEGTINLRGDLAGHRGDLPTGSVSGELMQAKLLQTLGNNSVESLSLGSGTVQASATATGFSAQVALDSGASGAITGKLTGERNTGDWQDYPIHGTLDARTDGLALLDMYVGGIDKATGQFTTHVDISGTLGDPALAGRLQLRDASIDIYQVGSSLRDLSLDARFDAQALDITGQSRLGDGTAHFNGKLSWRDNLPHGNLHVDGEHLRVVDIPEARLEASPNLDFKIDGRQIHATGGVLIPKAKLEPKDLTTAVVASDDENLVGAVSVDPERRWIVTSEIKLALGDDVNLNTLGLTAQLGGSVTVSRDEFQKTTGQGELNIKKGKYLKYGRQLDIERGRLRFDGSLNNPSVELRAQKEFPDVTAGIIVRGRLRSPDRPIFYSDPELPQQQIFSLLVAGGSLDSVQNNERPGAARNELLAQGGGLLAQRLSGHFGLDTVGVESGFDSDFNNPTSSLLTSTSPVTSTSVVFGKYLLSDRFYVSYGISLAEAINTFKMRWTIGKGWTVKTEAGKARSADIVYTIKKGKKDKDKEEKAKK